MPVTIDVGDWFAELGQISGSHAVSDPITRRRNSVFGHIARLSEDTPAHQALQVSCRSDSRPSSRPKLEASPRSSQQPMDWPAMRRDNNTPPADLWRRSTTRGHSGWRYGPRRLHVDDCDMLCWHLYTWMHSLKRIRSATRGAIIKSGAGISTIIIHLCLSLS